MRATHLTYESIINQGSYYTPAKIVNKTYELLSSVASLNKSTVILEPSCGYGVFFCSDAIPTVNRYIGADIDEEAIAFAAKAFAGVDFYVKNALVDVSRANYGISEEDQLIIVGNPPYNDFTSHVKSGVKNGRQFIADPDIVSRDLGLSSMLAYNKLGADYIAILHPLSYIIKKANFNKLQKFMTNYSLKDALVFSSQEFSDTSKTTCFPIVIAVYEKDSAGTTYDDILKWTFRTLEGNSFSLAQYEYITKYVSKYPNKYTKKASSDILFYTLRDINALRRSRTFIAEDIPNAIHIDKSKLDFYFYIDVFKRYAAPRIPYYMGNLDIPIDSKRFAQLADSFRVLSYNANKSILQNSVDFQVSLDQETAEINVKQYFDDLLGFSAKENVYA